jgi:hypothetical protein
VFVLNGHILSHKTSGWLDGLAGGLLDVKGVLRIAYGNQKLKLQICQPNKFTGLHQVHQNLVT